MWMHGALGAAWWLSGLSAQSFAAAVPIDVELPAPTVPSDGAVWAGDLDGDHRPDVLIVASRPTESAIAPQRRVWALHSRDAVAPRPLGPARELRVDDQPLDLGQGTALEVTSSATGRITPRRIRPAKGADCAPRCVDFDGDGRFELVFARVGLDPLGADEPAPECRGPLCMFAAVDATAWRGPLAVPGLRSDEQMRPAPPDAPIALPGTRLSPVGFTRLPQLTRVDGLAICDWNGDGRVDLAMQRDGVLQLHLGSPDGFTDGQPLASAGFPLRLEGEADPWLVDLDRDGRVDLVTVAADQSVTWRRGARHETRGVELGAATPLHPPLATGARHLAVVDWDGDGRLDLLLAENLQARPTAQPSDATPTRRGRLLVLRWLRQT